MTVDEVAGAERFTPGAVVRIGRAADVDLRVGDRRVGGRWTVSDRHVEVRWDGVRWATSNVSSRSGLLRVYEPGWEEIVLEPGRSWSPVRHRWSYALGLPERFFHVVCVTDDHEPAGDAVAPARGGDDEEATAVLPAVTLPLFTELERAVVAAYYGDFGCLPRPSVLEASSHAEAARRLGRSTDSARKAVERVNQKLARVVDAPAAATGRTISPEIGRWLARVGLLDP